jgi:hypothetical protein
MRRFVKILLGIAVGLIVWFVLATVGNLLLRAAIRGYTEAEPTFQFTLPMLLARLALGAISSVVAGLACARSIRSIPRVAWAFAVVLVLLFLPVHYRLWAQFPPWYHAVFLVSLAPLVLLGAHLGRTSPSAVDRAAQSRDDLGAGYRDR